MKPSWSATVVGMILGKKENKKNDTKENNFDNEKLKTKNSIQKIKYKNHEKLKTIKTFFGVKK